MRRAGTGDLIGEGPEQALDHRVLDILDDEHQARPLISVRPGGKPDRWVEYVLDAMQDHRALRIVSQLHDPLHAQHVRPVIGLQEFEEEFQTLSADGAVRAEAEGADVCVMA